MNNLESALAGIEQMTSKATEGPWKTGMKLSRYVYSQDMLAICECDSSVDDLPTVQEDRNAAFIAASRTLVPALVKALRTAVEQRNIYAKIARVRKVVIEEDDEALAAILTNGREGE